MKYEELEPYIESTGKGKIVSIQARVYPAGFGQVILRHSGSTPQPSELMCNNIEEAVCHLRDIWGIPG